MNDQTSRRDVCFLLSFLGSDVAGSEKAIARKLGKTIKMLEENDQ